MKLIFKSLQCRLQAVSAAPSEGGTACDFFDLLKLFDIQQIL